MSAEGDQLAGRVRALAGAVEAADGRCDPQVVEAARSVVARAGARVAFGGGHAVVALAGATGSGKSSLFNAISGTQFAPVGVRRPTTAIPMALAWGRELPHDLLDWLEVKRRQLVTSDRHGFTDLVLLDLPDYDSTEVTHRLTVDRLVDLADLLIWVVDPQKYADAALHDGYLKRLAPYAEVMMVVLNQSDRLDSDEEEQCRKDLRRLLDENGLRATPLLVTSATNGAGVAQLCDALALAVEGKRVMVRRLSADVSVAAAALADDLGTAAVPVLSAKLEKVVVTLGVAAGVPVAADGVRSAWRRRGALATGWPLVSWVQRFRPDPLRLLHLQSGPDTQSLTQVNRTSLPKATAIQRAGVDQGLRELVESATEGLPRGWAQAVRVAGRAQEARLLDRLDVAIAQTDLGVSGRAWWWGLIGAVQWTLTVAAVGGLVWLLADPWLIGAGVPPVRWYGWPAGMWLLVSGVLGGVLLAVLGRALVGISANLRAARARTRLEEAVRTVVAAEVLERMQAELDRFAQVRRLTSSAVLR